MLSHYNLLNFYCYRNSEFDENLFSLKFPLDSTLKLDICTLLLFQTTY